MHCYFIFSIVEAFLNFVKSSKYLLNDVYSLTLLLLFVSLLAFYLSLFFCPIIFIFLLCLIFHFYSKTEGFFCVTAQAFLALKCGL